MIKQFYGLRRVDFLSRLIRNMSSFVSHVNAVTGKMDWMLQDDKYDYHQEIARSAYADMLHDTERNRKYYAALKQAVGLLHSQGRKVHVLDIGTGTGLLSMMAVAAGADSVTACEAFQPMAKCAKRIMENNKCGGKIKLIPKRSTELTVGPEGDMFRRANVLVTEVFDTELIGEGAIGTFNHAHLELLEVDCIVIPRAANVYAQPVCSDLVSRWNQIDMSLIKARIPVDMSQCGGAPSLHDLQLDQLPTKHFTPLSHPHCVFRFDFGAKEGLQQTRKCETQIVACNSGRVDAVFLWWDCEMDPKGQIILSCAPRWAHPDGANLPWRDHWMQAIYYPSSSLSVSQGNTFTLLSCHDEYSFWFDVFEDRKSWSGASDHPVCVCGFHTTLSRSRIGMMSDPHRVSILQNVLRQHVKQSTVCLCVSDGSLLSIMAAKLGAKVYVLETNSLYKRVTESLVKYNELSDLITVIDKQPEEMSHSDVDNKKIDLVVGEPFFCTSLLPWHNIHMWYAVRSLSHLLTESAIVLPATMVLKAIAMEFDHLWKIRAPVGVCEGFDLSEFDQLIKSSAEVSDNNVEPQPLWEYPGTALSHTAQVLVLDNSHLTEDVQTTSHLHIETTGQLNGVALWTEFEFGDGKTVSGGPREKVRVGERVSWDLYTRQGLHLLQTPHTVNRGDSISLTVNFNPDLGEFSFTFKT